MTVLAMRPARATEARVLVRATFVIALLCGATAVFPFSDTAPRALAAWLAVVGLALGLVLRRLADRLTGAHVHAFLVAVTAVMTVCVAGATTPNGAVVTAVTFLWIAVYSAAFHSRRALAVHLLLIGAGMAYGLWASPAPSLTQSWLFLMGTFGGTAWILNDKVTGLREDATHDPLTGTLTRRAFLEAAEREMSWAARTKQPLTVIVIDLDDFKGVNDRHGHGAGDAVLAGLPRVWNPHLRPRDALGRLGGDEFAVLLPAADEDDADAVLQRLRRATLDIRISAGAAQWSGQPLATWLAEADSSLYQDKAPKQAARNRTADQAPQSRP